MAAFSTIKNLDYNQKQHSGYGFLLWVTFVWLLTATVTLGASERTYIFGVVPQQSATKLAQNWIPLLQELEQQTGVKLRFATAPDIPTFEKRLANGQYDLAYMNPYHYTVFHKKPGYFAFAKQADKRITGILVVPLNSPYLSVDDLQGQNMAFPAPASFAATLLVQSYLNKKGIKFNPIYVSSHDSVYRAVASGFVDSGGGIPRTLENIDPQVQAKLRILWQSEGFTPHAFAAHPRISLPIVDKLQQAMEKINDYPEGMAVLKIINFTAIDKAVNTDWDDVRNLDINALKLED